MIPIKFNMIKLYSLHEYAWTVKSQSPDIANNFPAV